MIMARRCEFGGVHVPGGRAGQHDRAFVGAVPLRRVVAAMTSHPAVNYIGFTVNNRCVSLGARSHIAARAPACRVAVVVAEWRSSASSRASGVAHHRSDDATPRTIAHLVAPLSSLRRPPPPPR